MSVKGREDKADKSVFGLPLYRKLTEFVSGWFFAAIGCVMPSSGGSEEIP